MNKVIGLLILLYTLAPLAQAGLLITIETKSIKDPSEPPTIMIVKVSGDNLAINNNASNEKHTMVFRGDRNLFWNIDHDRQEYIEINKEIFKLISTQLDAVQVKMKEAMAQMPPEQRAMMESMMKNSLATAMQGVSGIPKITFKKTNQKKTINGYPCVRFDVFKNGEKDNEIWATSWKAMGVEKGALNAFSKMAVFMNQLIATMKNNPYVQRMNTDIPDLSQIDGFPVRVRSFKHGKVMRETTFTSVIKVKTSNADFTPPNNYRKKTMPGVTH